MSEEQKRKRPKFKGPVKSRQHRRSKERRGNVDTSKMNEGGFYPDMPGFHDDGYGNRKFLTFVVTPEGDAKTHIFGPPQLAKLCVENAIEDNQMIRQIIYGATVDHMFKNKTPWNWILRMAYKRRFRKRHKQMVEIRSKQAAKISKPINNNKS